VAWESEVGSGVVVIDRLDEWQKKEGLRCNITELLAYFYTKDVVRGRVRPGQWARGAGKGPLGIRGCLQQARNNSGRRNIKIDFKPHV